MLELKLEKDDWIEVEMVEKGSVNINQSILFLKILFLQGYPRCS